MKRTKVQCGECTYYFIYMTPTKTINNPKPTVKLKATGGKGAVWFPIRDNDRQLTLIENHCRPKQRNTKHRKNDHRMPTQITP
jgi:hypothetical protein